MHLREEVPTPVGIVQGDDPGLAPQNAYDVTRLITLDGNAHPGLDSASLRIGPEANSVACDRTVTLQAFDPAPYGATRHLQLFGELSYARPRVRAQQGEKPLIERIHFSWLPAIELAKRS